MIRFSLSKLTLLLLIVIFVSSCGVNKVRIAKSTNGPKNLYINLANDPLLISIELRSILETKGYKIALSSEESSKSVKVKDGNNEITYKNVSDSNYRYELTLGYQPIQGRIELIAASVRDRKNNTILGTYRWSWDHIMPAPTIEKAIIMIDENLLSKIFSS